MEQPEHTITFILTDLQGRRAAAVFKGVLQPLVLSMDLAGYQPVEVRRFTDYGENYVYEWLAEGEVTGVKP